MTTIYGIRNCDTMKKTFAWFESHGVAYDFIDYKKGSVASDLLPDWIARAGWQALLNTQGMTWRRLSEAERAGMTAEKARALMVAYPTLIKRPVVDAGARLLVGFHPTEFARTFAKP